MSKAPVAARPFASHCVPSPKRPNAVRTPTWLLPAVLIVALGPVVLTVAGLIVVALRPAAPPIPEVAVVEPAGEMIEREPAPVLAAVEAIPAPVAIDPGEARPPIPGMRPPVTDVPVAVGEPEPVVANPARPPRCDRFGTTIDFVRSPAIAFNQAAADGKLVLVLHLAGHFEDPGFT